MNDLARGLVLVGILLATKLVGFAAVGAAGADPFRPSTASWLGLLATGVVLAAAFHRVLRDRSPASTGWRFDRPAAIGSWGVVALAGLSASLVAVLAAFDLLDISELGAAIAAWTPQERLFFAGIGLVAAAFEETAFRGVLLPDLERRLGLPLGALASAALFSVYHLQAHPAALLSKLLFGLVLAGMRHVSGGLVAPAVGHFLFWAVFGAI
jgi:membrane protease YdiL (CAAX protease family)